MTFLKTILIISVMIAFIIVGGCTDEEPVVQGNAQGIAITVIPTTIGVQNITDNTTIVIITEVPTTAPTPTPTLTPQPIKITQSGDSLPWCNIKRECDQGIRSYKSELCISAQQIPTLVMDMYCGVVVQTSSEDRPPRTAENGTLLYNESGILIT